MKLFLILAVSLLFSDIAYAKEVTDRPVEPSIDAPKTFHKPLTLERVTDGDTIVASGKKIRLWGIDAPEKNEPTFLASKMFLEAITKDKILTCKFIEKDKYQRDVMHCLADNADIGSIMVYMGMAKDFSKYSGDYYQYEEGLAKAKKRGIWKDKE